MDVTGRDDRRPVRESRASLIRVTTVASLRAQRDERIDLSGAARGYEAGRERH